MEHSIKSSSDDDVFHSEENSFLYLPQSTKIGTNLPRDTYDSWCVENDAPISKEDIKRQFIVLRDLFGFQTDNTENMYDHFMVQLDSRLSRMPCPKALVSLHYDYIGSDRSNFKKWHFAVRPDADQVPDSTYTFKHRYKRFESNDTPYQLHDLEDENCFLAVEYKWRERMATYIDRDYVFQVGLYLLIWGEANNIRFMPECLCFIYQNAIDYFYSRSNHIVEAPEFTFLNDVITPLYNYVKDQMYVELAGRLIKRDKDHANIIGYDDANQFFWFAKSIRSLKLKDGTLFQTFAAGERYHKIKDIDWNAAFYKTFREYRTWDHIFTDFSRVWIIHLTMFYYFTCFNSPTLYTKNYIQLLDNQPASQVQWTMVALGGSLACFLSICATINEFRFVPRKWPGASALIPRFLLLLLLLTINISPSIYILGWLPLDAHSIHGRYIGIGQFIASVMTFVYLAVTPPSMLFSGVLRRSADSRRAEMFTTRFPPLGARSRLFSFLLWISVFVAKFLESYFFLTLSLRDSIRVLSVMKIRCAGDVWFGNMLCQHQAKITLALLYSANLLLYFLDTYLWYIIFNSIFSVCLSFSHGISIFSPWRNIYIRLPERIASKLIFTTGSSQKNSLVLISHIWNSIIVSLYREHLLSIDQVEKLVYKSDESRVKDEVSGISPPLFFVYQDDHSVNIDEFLSAGREAERRISFFAQLLAMSLPVPLSTLATPIFTVLVPHYSEKIVLGLREIIRESEKLKLSLLEYLKQLHPNEWEAFVKDTKILKEVISFPYDEHQTYGPTPDHHQDQNSQESLIQTHLDDIPFYCIGFKDATPQYTLRTRIWSSLRYQTLYRTVLGFMNYENALKILYRIEHQEIDSEYEEQPGLVEAALTRFAARKFKLLIAMQRFQDFSESERQDCDLLFRTYPHLNIAILERETDPESGDVMFYSTLLDVSTVTNGEYRKKYRIRLLGNPILGDGKSDNQNSALIFYRGEYIQVVDANQDNYIEECLKIKMVLAEFEEMDLSLLQSLYVPGLFSEPEASVAILGAREYVFSENIGVLGDIAAGKEQTFGTLFARLLAKIGGKLHYGHPDFLNGIFMTTRGGISKAQRGLHLNEDIYAGMNATCRGGRIKHCDFYQCGKGRDLGFGTILNFTTKVGAGMGEQMLSREYFYMGTSLPIDRFLSFYYAHPGFHINNMTIMLSIELFMVVLVNLGALRYETVLCKYDVNRPYTALEEPIGCYNLQPVLHWVSRFVTLVLICFFISFVPLIIQELVEKGLFKALYRVLHHILSFAPLFEVFVCQVYAKLLRDNLTFGGARYIATGRGFATARIPFSTLYARYASICIYTGVKICLIVTFAMVSMWQPALLWFCITVISLCLAPFVFNPHQFEWPNFLLDYREYMRWLSRGNGRQNSKSWALYARHQRLNFTGLCIDKTTMIQETVSLRRSSRMKIAFTEVCIPMGSTILYMVPYMYINAQTGVVNPPKVDPLARIFLVALFPLIANAVILAIFAIITGVLATPLSNWKRYPEFVSPVIAGIVHGAAVVVNLISMEGLLYMEGFNTVRTICGAICVVNMRKTLQNIFLVFFISRERQDETINSAWWLGQWRGHGLGWRILTQPWREFVVKIFENDRFANDVFIGHGLLVAMLPIMVIPYIDRWHLWMLFWLRPSRQFRSPLFSAKQRKQRFWRMLRYGILYVVVSILLLSLVLVSIFGERFLPGFKLPTVVARLIQPNKQDNNDYGEDKAPSYFMREVPGAQPSMQTVP